MNRLIFSWMGRYYNIIKYDEKVGEVFYGIRSKGFRVRIERETILSLSELEQITEFIKLQNDSDKAYT